MSGDLYYRVIVTAGMVDYDLSSDLSSLVLEEHHRLPATLTIDLADPFKVFGHALREGMEISLDLGTDDDHSVLFVGRIYRVEAEFPGEGVPRLWLHALDNLMRMGLRQRSRAFKEQSLSSVVEAVATEHFGSTTVRVAGDPSFTRNRIRQHEETDLAFLLRLADESDCEMYVDLDGATEVFVFEAKAALMAQDAVETLCHGRVGVEAGLYRFSATADIAQIDLPGARSGIDATTGAILDVVVGASEDIGDVEDSRYDENLTAFRAEREAAAVSLELLIEQAPAVVDELALELGDHRREAIPTFTTDAELLELSRNQNATRLRGMEGRGELPGNTNLRANKVVRLDDLGGRFSGDWYLTRVRQVVGARGHRTEFECRR